MANVATNIFPVGNITVIVVYMVAGSYPASLLLTNDHVAPVSNIVGTANLWLWTRKYKKPCCVLTLFTSG